jgi:hypothetical protein
MLSCLLEQDSTIIDTETGHAGGKRQQPVSFNRISQYAPDKQHHQQPGHSRGDAIPDG